MSETSREDASTTGSSGFLARLIRTVVLFLAVYALGIAPAFKLCWQHPALASAFGPALETAYHPLILYLGQHPYSRLDRFYYWYATAVWKIPMERN